ncbi:hypothetical protein OR1_02347 [Geobacter sp. OR-1]|nr:hypothetical protein OR1_02347 [Geobacter sp. OR-1]
MAADSGQIRCAGVIVIGRDKCRKGRRGVIIKNESLTGILGKVDDDIGTLGRAEDNRAVVDIANIKQGRIQNERDRLVVYNNRLREKSSLVADLYPFGARGRRIGNPSYPAVGSGIPVRVAGINNSRNHLNFRLGGAGPVAEGVHGIGINGGIRLVQLQVYETVMGSIQDS